MARTVVVVGLAQSAVDSGDDHCYWAAAGYLDRAVNCATQSPFDRAGHPAVFLMLNWVTSCGLRSTFGRYLLGTDVWVTIDEPARARARITLVAAAYITLARLAIGAILGSIAVGDRTVGDPHHHRRWASSRPVPMLISSMI